MHSCSHFSVEENFQEKGKSTGVWQMEVKILHRFSALRQNKWTARLQRKQIQSSNLLRTAKLLARMKMGLHLRNYAVLCFLQKCTAQRSLCVFFQSSVFNIHNDTN
jgi:hypothetical protein